MLRRGTREEIACSRPGPPPIPEGGYFDSRRIPQQAYAAAPAPGGPSFCSPGRRVGTIDRSYYTTAAPLRRPYYTTAAPLPTPTLAGGVHPNALPSALKALKYRSTPYERPSPAPPDRQARARAAL
jgi:hypothetical protein